MRHGPMLEASSCLSAQARKAQVYSPHSPLRWFMTAFPRNSCQEERARCLTSSVSAARHRQIQIRTITRHFFPPLDLLSGAPYCVDPSLIIDGSFILVSLCYFISCFSVSLSVFLRRSSWLRVSDYELPLSHGVGLTACSHIMTCCICLLDHISPSMSPIYLLQG